MRKKDLPSLSSLIAFEAAARHKSFKRASEEICVSQAAISKQIRLLEENLSGALFDRSHRTVTLNAAGKLFLDAVSLGLSHIEVAANELRNSHESASITIGMMSSMAGLFLSPRIGDFKKLHPDIDIYIVSLDRNPDPQRDHFDILVTMGNSPSSQYDSTDLFSEEIFPVCSPAYLQKNIPIKIASDLIEHTLLNTDDEHWANFPWAPINWSYWFEQFGRNTSDIKGLRYNNYSMMINTVLNGHGVCLGWKHLVSNLIKDGSLVRPVEEKLNPDRHHYLLVRKLTASRKDIKIFKSWFLEQILEIDNCN